MSKDKKLLNFYILNFIRRCKSMYVSLNAQIIKPIMMFIEPNKYNLLDGDYREGKNVDSTTMHRSFNSKCVTMRLLHGLCVRESIQVAQFYNVLR